MLTKPFFASQLKVAAIGSVTLKCLDDLISKINRPRLIPSYKQNERRLLSIFMALLEISPTIRGLFFEKCGYRSGKTCHYQSLMEVQYKGAKYPEVRPDGLAVCSRGKTTWSAFIEAKSEKSPIRPEQIQDYLSLANMCDVDAVITISNEFARAADELPYHIATSKRKGREIYHFSWADIRTFLELLRQKNSLEQTDYHLVTECLRYFSEPGSGVQTYDAMPQTWPDFVEAAGTALGFGANMKGVTEIIHGWQQERRDLCSKLLMLTNRDIELRHFAGVRSTEDERLKADRSALAEDYVLSAEYLDKDSKATILVQADLRSRKSTVALDVAPPSGKGAVATVRWVAASLEDLDSSDLSNLIISFDWPGRGQGTTVQAAYLIENQDAVYEGQKNAPRTIRFMFEAADARAFKSRKKFIEQLEDTTARLVEITIEKGWWK